MTHGTKEGQTFDVTPHKLGSQGKLNYIYMRNAPFIFINLPIQT